MKMPSSFLSRRNSRLASHAALAVAGLGRVRIVKLKLLSWIIALLPLAGFGQPSKSAVAPIKIATVDHSILYKNLGYQTLREFEYGKSHRRILRDHKHQLEEAQNRLLQAKNSKELQQAEAEVSLLTKKMSALSALASKQRGGDTSREELEALIRENFSKDYSIILMNLSGRSTGTLANVVVANVEYVNITEPVMALVKKEMGEK